MILFLDFDNSVHMTFKTLSAALWKAVMVTGTHGNKMCCVLAVFSGFADGGAADGMGQGSSSCYRTAEDVCAGQWILNYRLWFLGAGLSSTLFMAEFGVREHLCLQVHVTLGL